MTRPSDSKPKAPPLMHLPYPGFIHFQHFMPQCDINVLHLLASKTWASAGRPLLMAEIGSFTGASALALAEYCERLYCVDTWDGSDNPDDPINELYAIHKGDVWTAFWENVKHLDPICFPLKKTSLRAAEFLTQSRDRFDLVFLDGDHRYESVASDIKAWLPLVSPGGILCGHDYDQRPNPQFPGVNKAVEERFLGPIIGHSGFKVLGNVWWREV